MQAQRAFLQRILEGRKKEGTSLPIAGMRIIDWCGVLGVLSKCRIKQQKQQQRPDDLIDCFSVLDRPVDKGKAATARLPPKQWKMPSFLVADHICHRYKPS
jgi:hypothetical protein